MTYILVIWTAITCSGPYCRYDWRPLGEFHMEDGSRLKKPAEQMCQEAAQQLGLKTDSFRCVRSK